MKSWLLASGILLLAACTQTEEKNQTEVLNKEVYKTRLGDQEVYGVRLQLTTYQPGNGVNYIIRLSQNEKVWIDTLMIDLQQGDTVETEMIFSEAVVMDKDNVELQTERLDFE